MKAISLGFQLNDGGRAAAGYKGSAGDCVCRALTILEAGDYKANYKELAAGEAAAGKARSARNGIGVKVYQKVFAAHGLVKVKLPPGPKPTYAEAHQRYGDCIVSTSHHLACLKAGSLQDTFDGRTYSWADGYGGEEIRERKAAAVWVRK